ncbi:MAG: hypothetical protein HOV81_08225 [Kofleriaceae bacterium]|nr:hypothetical protein [Kofleriaceae bacterium]
MKRWITASCVLALAACQTEPNTAATRQGLEECNPGGNYPDAKLPKLALWTGQTPQAGPGQLFMDQKDPYTAGRHWAFLVDPGAGTIVWGAILKDDKQLSTFRALVPSGQPMIGDCCRPPPPPPGGGDDWIARNVLEDALLYSQVRDVGAGNADP